MFNKRYKIFYKSVASIALLGILFSVIPSSTFATDATENNNQCVIEVVSDTTNMVDGGNAVATFGDNIEWTASIPGATWIWKTALVENPTQEETYTFTKTFEVDLASVVNSASLVMAADNSYIVSLNGTEVGSDSTEFNYKEENKHTYNVASNLVDGTNTLSFTVKNWAVVDATSQSNPAGLLYSLRIVQEGDCSTTPPTPPAPTGDPTVTLTATPGIINPGESSTLAWNSSNADSCSSVWLDVMGTAGNTTVSPASTTDYVMSCTGNSKTVYATTTVTVNPVETPGPSCTMDIVSDTTNTIDSNNAVATYDSNPRWTASIPGATWIWKTLFVENPTQDENYTFLKKFNIDDVSKVKTASLVVAADNSYAVNLNGSNIGTDSTETNYFDGEKDTYDVKNGLQAGENEIYFEVKNWALTEGTPETNPAGLLYKLSITMEGEDCGNNNGGGTPTPSISLSANPQSITTGATSTLVWTSTNVTFCSAPWTTATSTSGSMDVAPTVTTDYAISCGGNYGTTTATTTVTVQNDGTDLSCKITSPDQNGWYGTYFNYSSTTEGMELPGSEWSNTHGDPLSKASAWTTVWYDSNFARFSRVDAGLGFGDLFFPFNANPEEITNGNEYHFGVRWEANVTASTSGSYDFVLTSDDDAWVYVNGELVGDNAGVHPYTTVNGSADLNEGVNLVQIFFAERHTSSSFMNFSFVDGTLVIKPYSSVCNPVNPPGNTPPVITLLGDNPFNLVVDNVFVDPMATSTDAEDGDLTSSIVVTGTVNASTTGSYTLTYTVTDSGGLSASTTRTVNVVPENGGGPTPSITLTANPSTITLGATSTLSWVSTNVNYCTAAWTNATSTSGSMDVAPTVTTDYSISCGGTYGTTTATTTVTVTTGNNGGGTPTPSISLSANPQSITTGATSTLVWTSTNVTFCSAPWTTATSTSGSMDVAPTVTTDYAISCGGNYGTTTATTTVTVNTDNNGGGGNGGGGSQSGRRQDISHLLATGVQGEVLGATSCSYLRDHLKIDWVNDPLEMLKLKSFLNVFEKESLPLTSTFDAQTFDAVSRFQIKYFDDVLAPWGHDTSTGFVYITTKKKINEIYCNTLLSLSEAERQEISDFRSMIESYGSSYYSGAGVGVNSDVLGDLYDGGVASVDLKDNSAEEESPLEKSLIKNAAISLFSLPQNILGDTRYVGLALVILAIVVFLIKKILFGGDDNQIEKVVTKTEVGTPVSKAEGSPTIILPGANTENKKEENRG